MTCVCLLLLFCSHYQIVVVSYSPGVSFDRSRPPNEVFGEDRFVPYGMVSVVVETCGCTFLAIALYCSCDSVSEAVCIPCSLLFQATSTPVSDQLLVFVVAEFAADLFPESKMFTLGSSGPNDNDKYTNPTLQHSTAYTYFVICLPDTARDSLNVSTLQPCCWYTQCCCLFVCLFVSQDPLARRVTNYSLAGFSSFGSEYTLGEWHSSDH